MRVTVSLRQDKEMNATYFRVEVHSQIKPGLLGTVRVFPGMNGLNSPLDVQRMIGAAGGAAAEYLCENYGDNIDPSEAAKLALTAFHDLCTKLADGQRKLQAR